MNTYTAKCDICGMENTVASYGDWACRQCGQGYTYDECHQIRLTDAQLALLRSPPRWIPVEERLPFMGEEVLVTADGWMRIAYWGLNGWAMTGMGRLDTTKPPSHWMPLPWDAPRTEPPEVK